MNPDPNPPTPSSLSPTFPGLLLLLPEHCSSLRPTATGTANRPPFLPRGPALSTTFEFVFTSNHRHDGINE